MKRMLGFTMIVLGALLLGACTPASLNPLASKEAVVVEPRIVGEWERTDAKGDRTTIGVEDAGEETYKGKLVYTRAKPKPEESKEETVRFRFQLVKLSDQLFADVSADKDAAAFHSGDAIFAMPVHAVVKVDVAADSLGISMMSAEWLDKLLKADDNAIAHAHVKENPPFLIPTVITASTQDLQAFVKKHAADEKAFPLSGEKFARKGAKK
jgi:hypothetical protein